MGSFFLKKMRVDHGIVLPDRSFFVLVLVVMVLALVGVSAAISSGRLTRFHLDSQES